MRSKIPASILALSAAVSALPADAAVRDFRLPTERPEQQPPPDLQGPVAPDVPASRRAPATPAPTPAPRAEPSAAPAAMPIEVPTGLLAGEDPAPRRAQPPASSSAAPGAAADAVEPATEPGSGVPAATPEAAATSQARPAAGPEPATSSAEEAWPWLLGLFPVLLAALGAAVWAARRRERQRDRPAEAPPIERPRPTTPPVTQPANPLQVELEPVRLSLTLVNATLAYRLELANRGPAPLTGLAIGADMISAHASMSREEQLSGPRPANAAGGSGAPLRRIDRLEPGERCVVEGEFRLPLPQIVPIRQGNAALLVPLARFRVEADGTTPLVRTYAIGQPGRGQGLQPFRLDQGPRIYPRLTQHAFA